MTQSAVIPSLAWITMAALVSGCGGGGEASPDTGSGDGATTNASDGADPMTTATQTDATFGSTEPSPMDGTDTTAVGVTTTDDGGTADETTDGSPWMGRPLPDAEVGQWQWVDIEGTECINGNSTGLGVRYGTSENLAIYFEGGGACFNAVSCAAYYLSFANFDEGIFNAIIPTQLSNGVFDRENPDNPLRDWSFVYIPYCTGDVHAGEQDEGNVEGFPGVQKFVGYRNFTLNLERIGPTFPNPERVLVVGISAGGFGASVNYDRIADAYAYANVPVTLLDDSGPPFGDERAPACLQEQWRELWRLDDTLPPACVGCFGEGGFLIDLALYLRDKYPDEWFGLLSSEQDSTIRTYLGPGLNDCAGGQYPAEDYQAGLYELRDELLADAPSFASYYMPGEEHTSLTRDAYTTVEVQGVRIVDWVAAFLDGTATHISP